MQIREVTLFKIVFFAICIVVITIFVVKMVTVGNATDNKNMCQTLLMNPEVEASVVSEECPEGYLKNFGRFYDVDGDYICCVKYVGD
jgi:hypothetical protein